MYLHQKVLQSLTKQMIQHDSTPLFLGREEYQPILDIYGGREAVELLAELIDSIVDSPDNGCFTRDGATHKDCFVVALESDVISNVNYVDRNLEVVNTENVVAEVAYFNDTHTTHCKKYTIIITGSTNNLKSTFRRRLALEFLKDGSVRTSLDNNVAKQIVDTSEPQVRRIVDTTEPSGYRIVTVPKEDPIYLSEYELMEIADIIFKHVEMGDLCSAAREL